MRTCGNVASCASSKREEPRLKSPARTVQAFLKARRAITVWQCVDALASLCPRCSKVETYEYRIGYKGVPVQAWLAWMVARRGTPQQFTFRVGHSLFPRFIVPGSKWLDLVLEYQHITSAYGEDYDHIHNYI